MPGAARVSVRVVPDTKGFRETLQRYLSKTEKTLSVAIKVGVEESADFREKLKAITSEVGRQDATIKADADTKAASAELDAAAHTRTAKIRLKLPSNLGRIALITSAVSALGPLALSSTSGLLTMAAGIASLAALAAPLPGILMAGGVAAVVFVLALKNAGKELAALNPLWKKLNQTIQTNFWGSAKKPILDLVNSVFPQLKSGLADVASALGAWSGSVAKSFKDAFGGDAITSILGKLSDAIKKSMRGTDAFAQSVATLGKFGARYLPAIGDWFSEIAVKFNGWLQKVASDGVLAGWVSNAMIVLGQLGDVAKGVWGTINGLITASGRAGSGGLKTFSQGLLAISKAVNSPGFQTTLASIFAGAGKGASALRDSISHIGSMLAALPIGSILATIGTTVGKLASGIADALSQPGIGKDLLSAIRDISKGILSLIPAIGPLAAAIAPVLKALGPLAVILGKTLAKAIIKLAPTLGDFVKNTLPGLVETVRQGVPLFLKFVDAISAVVGWAAKLAEPLQAGAKAFEDLKNGTTDLTQVMSDALDGKFGGMTQAISQFVYNGGGMLHDFFANTTGMFQDFGSNTAGMFGDFFTNTLGMFTDFFTVNLPQGILAALSGAGQWLVGVGQAILQGLATGFAIGVVAISYFFTKFPSDMANWLAGAGAWLLQTGIDILNGFVTGMVIGYNAVVAWFAALPGKILSFTTAAGAWLLGVGITLLTGFVNGMGTGFSAVVSFFATMPGRILGMVGGAGLWLVQTGINMLHGVSSGAQTGVGSLWSFIRGLPGQIIGFFSGAGGWLFSAGVNIVRGLISGVRSLAGTIGAVFLNQLPDWIRGPFESALGIHSPSKVFAGYGVNIVDGLLNGIDSRQGVLDQSVRAMVTVPDALLSDSRAATNASGAGGSVQITNYITQPEDPRIIGRTVGREAARALAGSI